MVTASFLAILAKESSTILIFWFPQQGVYEEKNCKVLIIWLMLDVIWINIQEPLNLEPVMAKVKELPDCVREQDELKFSKDCDWNIL